MATITLSYDARNTLAKKTIDYILSLGFFNKVEENPIVNSQGKQVSEKEKIYLKRLEKVAKDIRENKNREEYQTWEDFANEI